MRVPSKPGCEEPRPLPVVLYSAKSTVDVHDSIPRQIAEMRKWVERQGGGRFIDGEPEVDEDKTAFHGNRGDGLARAKARAEKLVAEYGVCELLVWHGDRLARGDGVQADHLVQVLLWAMGAGVKLRAVENDVGVSDLLQGVITGMQSNAFSKRLSAVMPGAMLDAVKRGTHVGPVPYGYRKNREAPGGLVPDPVEAPIVRAIVAAALGDKPAQAISRDLNRDGIPTKHGRKWRNCTVRNVLRNPVYVGRQVGSDENEYEGKWEPLITEDDYATIQALRGARKKGTGGPRGGRRPSADFLFFGGHLLCECGEQMGPRSNNDNRRGTRYAVYECRGRRADKESCSMPPIRKEQIDGPVLDYLMRRGIDLEATAAELKRGDALRLAEAQAYAVRTAQERELVAGRLKRARAGYLDGTLEGPEYAQIRDELTAELAALTDQAERMEARHAEAIAAADASDTQENLLRWVASTREAIAFNLTTADAQGAATVRASLLLLFECFRLRRLGSDSLDPDWMPEGRGWEGDLLIPGELYIEPVIRPDARLVAEPMPFPEVRREPLHVAPNNEKVRFRT